MGEAIDYYNNNFDIQINPFNEPEKAEVLLYIACVENLLNQCEIINKYYDDKKTLNKSFIHVLKRQLNNVYINFQEARTMNNKILYYAFTEENKIIVWGVNIKDQYFDNIPEMLKFYGYDKYEYVFMNHYYKF